MGFVIGIDGGTESIRARVLDLAGDCKSAAATPYETAFSAGARAEQDPEEWWRAVGTSVRRSVREAGFAPHKIDAIAIDTTCCSVVALDDRGRALRPAIIWMDVRAEAEAAAVLATADPALVVNCAGEGPVSAEWMIPKALWIREHEPDIFERAATICEYQDYMNLRLTGRRCASLNNASVRWHYSTQRGGYARGLLSKLGLDALYEKWPTDVIAAGSVIGELTKEAAEHLGLKAGVKVAQGGADAFIGLIGLGVSKPGQLALITGSSHLLFGVTAHPVSASGLWGTYSDARLSPVFTLSKAARPRRDPSSIGCAGWGAVRST